MGVLVKKSNLPAVVGKSSVIGKAVVIGAPAELDPNLPAKKPVSKKDRQELLRKLASGALQSTALDRERVFDALYAGDGASGALAPPYDPDMLFRQVLENNTLQPCIDAMVTNIDGTGWEIVAADEEAEDVPEAEKEKCESFFNSVYPGCSFNALREKIRRDLETTGNAYVEVIRNALGEIGLLRRMDPSITRMMRYDNRTFEEDVYSASLGTTVKVEMRRRRYVQFSFGKLVYFKEFGAKAPLDRVTGKWGSMPDAEVQETNNTEGKDTGQVEGEPLNTQNNTAYTQESTVESDMPQGQSEGFKNANEVLHFTCLVHHEVPYGYPRWINQAPSVVGSRKAEMFNVGFFDAGGIPPLLMIVQGGATSEDVEKALKDMFYSKGPHKNIAAILQVEGTEGSLDRPGTAKVTVERFGNERQKDAMFDVYDKSCTQKVKRAFRLPHLFLGDTEEFNFATALASYKVAEAQVFAPERDKFDEVINSTLMPALMGVPQHELTVKFRSLPVTAKDMEQQLQAVLEAGKAGWIDPDEAVNNLNEVTGMEMMPSDDPMANVPQVFGQGMGFEHEAGQADASRDFEREMDETAAGREDKRRVQDQRFQASQNKMKFKQKPAAGKPPFARKQMVQRREIDILDVMVEVGARVIRSRRRGSQAAIDCVAFMKGLDPQRLELFGARLGRAIYDSAPADEVPAARLALAALKDAGESV